ncbi:MULTISPECIES: hypothetical protein [Calothrix]|nr:MULTISPECIES: hypothetical protein [Calothrix]
MKNYRLKTLPDILVSGGDGHWSTVNRQQSTVKKIFSPVARQ